MPLRVLALAFLIFSLSGPPAALAQAPAPTQPPADAQVAPQPGTPAPERPPAAELVYFNRPITVFRVRLFGVLPAVRAARATEVLDSILDGSEEGTVSSQSEPQGNLILVDGQLAFLLVPGDADPLVGETLASVTAQAVRSLEVVIAETRESRDRARLLRGALMAAAGTLVLAALIALVFFLQRLIDRRLVRLARWLSSATRFGGVQLLAIERLMHLERVFVRLAAWAFILVAVYRWLSFVLSQFPYTRPWGEQLRSFFVDTFQELGRGMIGGLPGLATAIMILLIARAAIGLVTPFIDRVAAGQLHVSWLDADTARPTKRLVVLGVWLFGIAMAYPYLPGSDTEAFQGISVLLGLMVTFGGSSLFGQAASGLILMYSRTLRVGEFVRIAEEEGTVTELGTFTTKVQTGLGEELTLPNAMILGTVVKNYSRTVQGKGFVVDTVVTIGYDTPWRQVEAMLIEAAHRTPGIIESPAPHVFQTALADFYPQYRLVCQAVPREPKPRAEVLARLHANIQDVFNEYGVQIMSPHYLGDPAQAKVVSKDEWHKAPASPRDA